MSVLDKAEPFRPLDSDRIGVRWKQHLDRTRRWHKRLQEAKGIRGFVDDDGLDMFFAFVQSAHTMKDWLHNDGLITREQAHAFLNEHQELLVCQDLCNGSKHLAINSHRVDDNPWFGRSLIEGHDEITFVRIGGDYYSLIELADNVLALWESYCEELRN